MTPDEVYAEQQEAIAEGAFDIKEPKEISVIIHLTVADWWTDEDGTIQDIAAEIAREANRLPGITVDDYEAVSEGE